MAGRMIKHTTANLKTLPDIRKYYSGKYWAEGSYFSLIGKMNHNSFMRIQHAVRFLF